jgi:hypothetical protein
MIIRQGLAFLLTSQDLPKPNDHQGHCKRNDNFGYTKLPFDVLEVTGYYRTFCEGKAVSRVGSTKTGDRSPGKCHLDDGHGDDKGEPPTAHRHCEPSMTRRIPSYTFITIDNDAPKNAGSQGHSEAK